jgi:serine/threonine-protein kinase RsbT
VKAAMSDDVRVAINDESDLVSARAEGRALAERQGFIATAISEVARNIVVHVGQGEIVLRPLEERTRCGLQVIARDEGRGIRDVEAALGHGSTTGRGLGLGLPGARRLMDDFEVASSPGRGTTVTMVKWRVRDELELMRERRSRA